MEVHRHYASNTPRICAEREYTGAPTTSDGTLSACRRTPVDVVSVQTPHATLNGAANCQQANDSAELLDALVAVHSIQTLS